MSIFQKRCHTKIREKIIKKKQQASKNTKKQENIEYKQVVKIEDFQGSIKYYTNTWSEEFTPKTWHPSDGPLTLSGLGRTTYLFYPYLSETRSCAAAKTAVRL